MTSPRVSVLPAGKREAGDILDGPPWLDLVPAAVSPGLARAWTRAVLAAWGRGYLSEDAELVVSELVANAAQASSSVGSKDPVRVCLANVGTALLVQVRDGSPALPAPRRPSVTDEFGRGLMIVDHIATQVGWHRTPGMPGKVVWCLIADGPVTGDVKNGR